MAEAKLRRRSARSKSREFHFGEKKAYLADLAEMEENELFDEADENKDVLYSWVLTTTVWIRAIRCGQKLDKN